MKGKLAKLIVFPFVLVFIFSVLYPLLSNAGEVKRMEVEAYGLNVREGASTSHKITGYLKKGDYVDVLKHSGNWAYIEYGSNKKGYVHSNYLKDITINTSRVISTKKVTADFLNVRQGPDVKYQVVGKINNGTVVKVHTNESNGWGYITTGNTKGYVNLSYLGDTNTSKPNTPTKPANGTTYTVQAGDTLYSISVKFKTTVSNIKKWNNLNSDIIHVGQKLVVSEKTIVENEKPNQENKPTNPPSTEKIYYIVQKGDNLYRIAKNHGVSQVDLRKWNNLTSDLIHPGQQIIVSEKVVTNPVDNPNTNPDEKPNNENNDKVYYIVKKGDYLYKIAKEHGMTVDELKELNKLTSNVIYSGQKLLVKGTPDDKEDEKPEVTTKKVYVTATSLTVRKGPSVSHPAITYVSMGTELTAYETTGDWTKVEYQPGKFGYVHNAYITEKTSSNALKGIKIVVDPGHGGGDPGAIGYGYKEKDMVLAISKKLQTKLQNAGAEVIMTRSSDVFYSLDYRSNLANSVKADLFISVHQNSAPNAPTATGIETYWYGSNASQKFATAVQKNLIAETGARDRQVKTANFAVLRNTTMPAVLVEVGFISNKQEADLIATEAYQYKLAEGILKGVIEYYK